jgi:hypothetical protein
LSEISGLKQMVQALVRWPQEPEESGCRLRMPRNWSSTSTEHMEELQKIIIEGSLKLLWRHSNDLLRSFWGFVVALGWALRRSMIVKKLADSVGVPLRL